MIPAMPRTSFCAAALTASLVLPLALHAQEWSGQLTAYGWGAGVSGDFTPFTGAPTLSFDKSFSEVLDDLDGAFFATGLARRGDVVFFGDLTYSRSSREGILPPGIPAAGEVSIRALTLAAGRRFDGGQGSSIDLLVGARAWKVEGEVASPILSVSPGTSFVDPLLALRTNTSLAGRWSLISYADFGGFGAGSDITWQAAITANYQASDRLYLSVGWRHLYLDYEKDGTAFEGAMTGPLVGVTWTF